MSSSSAHKIEHSQVTVIVAAKNEEKNIWNCVHSILEAAQGAYVIIVDDGSTDETHNILKTFEEKITVLRTSGIGPAAARNAAMRSITSPYVAFADGDSVVEKSWLSSLIRNLNDKESVFVGIGGVQKGFAVAGDWEAFHVRFLESMGFVSDYVHTGKKVKEVQHNPTCNVLYLREPLLDVGGFDETLWPCEDLDMDLRLRKKGFRFLFTPQAVIYHHRPNSFMGFMNMMKRYGFGHAQIVKKHGPCQPIHLLPFLVLAVPALLVTYPGIIPSVIDTFRNTQIGAYLFVALLLSLKKLHYVFYLLPSVIFWNLGFFSGLMQKAKITKK